MRLHRQFAFILGERGLLFRCKILRELIRRGIANFYTAVFVGQRFVKPIDRFAIGRSADVARAE